MANKVTAQFHISFQSDGTSLELVVDLSNDPIEISIGGSGSSFRLKNFEVGFPSDVNGVTGPDGTSSNIQSSSLDQSAKTLTVTFKSAFSVGDQSLSGTFV